MNVKNKYIDIVIGKYKNMPIAAKATIWFLFCSIMQKGLAFISTPIFTRLMPTEQYGQYGIYLSWLQLVTIFVTLRLDWSVYNKGMTKYSNDKETYTLSMQVICLILSVGLFVFYILFSNIINRFVELGTEIMLLLFLEILFIPAVNFWTIRQRYDYRYKQIVFVTLLMSLSNLFLGIILVIRFDGLGISRIISTVAVQCLFGASLFIVNWRKAKGKVSWKYMKFAVLFNIPLLPHYFSSYLLEQADRIMIQKMRNLSEVGLYNVAYNAGMVMNIFTSSINNALGPWQYRKLKEEQYEKLNKLFIQIILGLAFIVIIFCAFAPELVKLLADSAYWDAMRIVPPVAASVFFIFIYTFFGNVEFFYDSNKMTMYISMAGAVLNIILNYIFINMFGYVSAGYTTLVCYVVFALSHYLYMNHVTKKKIGRKIYNGKVIGLISCVVVVMSIFFSFLYTRILLRYVIILLIISSLIIKRNKVMDVIKGIRNE